MTAMPDEQPSWERAARTKSAAASKRNAELASQAIALLRGRDLPPDWVRVATVVADGGRTWDEIGAALGMSKFEASGKFRRLLILAGLK